MARQGAAAPMFPFEDEDDELAQDDYGRALRPGEFQLKEGAVPGKLTFKALVQLPCSDTT